MTSNCDGRVYQLESYMADIIRVIGERHNLPRGNLIKPLRGVPRQRMLTLLSRGMRGFEWYTYGPDHYKGDSWSGDPRLLDAVAESNRFAGRAEEYIYEAKPMKKAEVELVNPRSSNIWEMATGKASEYKVLYSIYIGKL